MITDKNTYNGMLAGLAFTLAGMVGTIYRTAAHMPDLMYWLEIKAPEAWWRAGESILEGKAYAAIKGEDIEQDLIEFTDKMNLTFNRMIHNAPMAQSTRQLVEAFQSHLNDIRFPMAFVNVAE